MGAVGVPGDEDEAERDAGVDEEAAMGDARFPARAELAVQATNEEAPSNHLRLGFDRRAKIPNATRGCDPNV